MNTKDLIAGYAAYTNADELGTAHAEAPAITPTAATTSSAPCAASVTVSVSVSVHQTQEHNC